MQQATRLASRASAQLSRSNAAAHHSTPGLAAVSSSCSQASTSALRRSLHTSSGSHASSVEWTEVPLPVMAPKAATQASTSSSSTGKSKGKGKGRAPSTRELPLRKQFLMQQYKQILSASPVVIFLKPSDFSIEEITRLRVDLSLIPSTSSSSTSTSSNADDINSSTISRPRFIYLRAGLLPPLFEQMGNLPSDALLSHLSQTGQNMAALTFPSLDPPSLKAALKAVNKLSKTPNLRKLQAEAAAAAAAGGAAKGGKPAAGGAKKDAAPAEERLKVITAIVEGKSMNEPEIKKLSELPSLQDTLAQLVAVIDTPARTIHSLLSRAGGQDLARTLEGFKLALEEKEKPAES